MTIKRADFRTRLNRYMNGAVFSATDRVRALVSTEWNFRAHAARICADFRDLEPPLPTHPVEQVVVPPYRFQDHRIVEFRSLLENEFPADIHGVMVHGSFGSGDPVAYSDFDGLIILKDEVFQDPVRLTELAVKLHRMRSRMQQIDPLQHHGWFVLAAADLLQYPASFLPVEVLKNASSIYGNNPLHLQLARLQEDPLDRGFLRMAATLSAKIRNGRVPTNHYQAKAFMSEVMLLPTLYVQARDQRGIYKRDSFAAARVDFSPQVWSIMDEFSLMRSKWNFHPQGFDKWMLSQTSWFWLQWRKTRGTPLSPELQQLFKPSNMRAVENLILEMRQRIGK